MFVISIILLVLTLTGVITVFWVEISVATMFPIFWIAQTIQLEVESATAPQGRQLEQSRSGLSARCWTPLPPDPDRSYSATRAPCPVRHISVRSPAMALPTDREARQARTKPSTNALRFRRTEPDVPRHQSCSEVR